ncbi:hypothetical protein [Sinorhizobium sp. BG8]|uniref:hypothetical protein n=1 Tax=Sinorhizobium sp. BG8 TaxID=2613773 RepID=UPI00193E08A3|nr:hypothetical protein [Sinorhizobium sp. BG8]QRM56556.1 hypothetical protein F3Y30_19980 [Sinorhizobium sp. BG8]
MKASLPKWTKRLIGRTTGWSPSKHAEGKGPGDKSKASSKPSALPSWFASNHGVQVPATELPIGLYQSWIPEHTDALVHSLVSEDEYVLADLRILKDVESKAKRVEALRFAAKYPETYRRMVMHKLSPYKNQAKFLIATFDWQPFIRHVVYAAAQLRIPTVLVPHESVFAKKSMYYTHPVLGINTPACDLILAWGDLQERIFLERGYPAERIVKVGAPKFDYTDRIRDAGRRDAVEVLGLDPGKPIATFAVQPLDSQFDMQAAREAQNRSIRDLVQTGLEKGYQIIIRTPPSKDQVLASETIAYIHDSDGATIDDSSLYLLTPHETIEVSDVLVSVNSTMLLEAALSGKIAVSAKYMEFDQVWDSLRIPVVRNALEMSDLLDQAGRDPAAIVARYDTQWAASAFSAGVFDGRAAERIRAILSDIGHGRRKVDVGYALTVPFMPEQVPDT